MYARSLTLTTFSWADSGGYTTSKVNKRRIGREPSTIGRTPNGASEWEGREKRGAKLTSVLASSDAIGSPPAAAPPIDERFRFGSIVEGEREGGGGKEEGVGAVRQEAMIRWSGFGLLWR
jgi:hypothetical protein